MCKPDKYHVWSPAELCSCDATFVHNHCLHSFRTKRVYDCHATNCRRHLPQDVNYPNPKNPKKRVLKFYNKAVRFGLPFYLVCDFESFITTLNHDEENVDAKKATNLLDEHNVCGFACHQVSEYPEYQSDPAEESVYDHQQSRRDEK